MGIDYIKGGKEYEQAKRPVPPAPGQFPTPKEDIGNPSALPPPPKVIK